jgi:hypothetical protein
MLTPTKFTISIARIYIHFSEKGSVCFNRLSKGFVAQEKVKNPTLVVGTHTAMFNAKVFE